MKKKVFDFADEYRRFISLCKTERECVEEGVRILKAAGYKDLKDVIAADEKLKAGDTAIVHVQGHYVCISDYNKKTKNREHLYMSRVNIYLSLYRRNGNKAFYI